MNSDQPPQQPQNLTTLETENLNEKDQILPQNDQILGQTDQILSNDQILQPTEQILGQNDQSQVLSQPDQLNLQNTGFSYRTFF